MIPTAEEYVLSTMWGTDMEDIEAVLIGFAKIHVEAVLEGLSKNDLLYFTKVTQEDTGILWKTYDGFPFQNLTLNKEAILNSYPLSKIK